ncbi:hypothetical protein Q31a_42100 [Aureliella helgolandensis]|uniref:Uncharacterized protein n=1 Tax=Aureliella helgolandensis TaxID=2527968 RepID=A0A518GB98_9BACT|nr:hypothetical protein Q31a_42100 [Aureliella helgolandensis]
MALINQKSIVAVGIVSGALTGLISTRLALPFESYVMEADQNQGMSFHWTVLTFTGIGLIIGTLAGNGANLLIRWQGRNRSGRTEFASEKQPCEPRQDADKGC